jgi:dihydropteroate synthase
LRAKLLGRECDLKTLFKKLEVSSEGISIMTKKADTYTIYLKDLKCASANILKQDILSIGGELALPYFVAGCLKDRTDGVLIATEYQLKKLALKAKQQPFCLKELPAIIDSILEKRDFKKEIMGVLNLNEDSFYEGSRSSSSEILKRVSDLIEEGASIIDIGGVSSRPGSEWVETDEELRRISFGVEEIYKSGLYKEARFSIDTINPKVAEFCLDRGFSILNDIDGLGNIENAKVAAKYGASVVIMHKKGSPKNMQKNPEYEDVVFEIEDFFKERVSVAKSQGIKDIILDVGIGFGKSLEHNLTLLRDLEHFKSLGYPILVGASRKSMIDKISPSEPKDRLGGTLALHLEALKNGASIIRAHDVKEHIQALRVHEALRSFR